MRVPHHVVVVMLTWLALPLRLQLPQHGVVEMLTWLAFPLHVPPWVSGMVLGVVGLPAQNADRGVHTTEIGGGSALLTGSPSGV